MKNSTEKTVFCKICKWICLIIIVLTVAVGLCLTFRTHNKIDKVEKVRNIIYHHKNVIDSFYFNIQKENDLQCLLTDIRNEEHSLLDANSITFLIAIIVGILAALLLMRFEKMELLEKETKELLRQNKRRLKNQELYDLFLTQIESIFNIAIMLENNTANPQRYALAFRMRKSFEKILGNKKYRRELSFLSKDAKEILITYIEDSKDALGRAKSQAQNFRNETFDEFENQLDEIIDLINDISEESYDEIG